MMTPFKNRLEAAHVLAEELATYRGLHPLVLGVARGAVPMAGEIARILDGDLDIVLAHKIPAPGNPECALGAVGELGQVYMNPEATLLRIPPGYVDEEIRRQISLLKKRRQLYSRVHSPVSPRGRIAIVVDNGVATGATTIAALRDVRAGKPTELVLAVAVAPVPVIRKLQKEADRVVAAVKATDLISVGEYFEDFSQVSDDDVIRTLAEAHARASSP